MLIFDTRKIGNNLLNVRKKAGLTQAEVAEAAGLSDRTYADIERGSVNMKIETVLHICEAFHVTPDELLTEENPSIIARQADLFERLNNCSQKEKEAALNLLAVYLDSLTH